MCNKCENLHAVFGYGGRVKVSDARGRILYGAANEIFYQDFYEDGDPDEWPECPKCGWRLEVWTPDSKRAERLKAWSWRVTLTICIVIWSLILWLLFR